MGTRPQQLRLSNVGGASNYLYRSLVKVINMTLFGQLTRRCERLPLAKAEVKQMGPIPGFTVPNNFNIKIKRGVTLNGQALQ